MVVVGIDGVGKLFLTSVASTCPFNASYREGEVDRR